jgi:acetoacetyl-CoA synthetase
MTATATKLWSPTPERVANANLTAFAARLGARHGVDLSTYDAGDGPLTTNGISGGSMDEAASSARAVKRCWSMPTDARRQVVPTRASTLANLLERKRPDDETDALVFWGEDKIKRRVTRRTACTDFARVGAGGAWHRGCDRIAAYVPNMPEAVIAMLGATARARRVVVLAGAGAGC